MTAEEEGERIASQPPPPSSAKGDSPFFIPATLSPSESSAFASSYPFYFFTLATFFNFLPKKARRPPAREVEEIDCRKKLPFFGKNDKYGSARSRE